MNPNEVPKYVLEKLATLKEPGHPYAAFLPEYDELMNTLMASPLTGPHLELVARQVRVLLVAAESKRGLQ